MKIYTKPNLNLFQIDMIDLISSSSLGADYGWDVPEDPNDDN